jgi:hypothetical protein
MGISRSRYNWNGDIAVELNFDLRRLDSKSTGCLNLYRGTAIANSRLNLITWLSYCRGMLCNYWLGPIQGESKKTDTFDIQMNNKGVSFFWLTLYRYKLINYTYKAANPQATLWILVGLILTGAYEIKLRIYYLVLTWLLTRAVSCFNVSYSFFSSAAIIGYARTITFSIAFVVGTILEFNCFVMH